MSPKKGQRVAAGGSRANRNPEDDHKIAAECREKLLRTARRSVEKQKKLIEVNPSLQAHLNLVVAVDQYDLVRLRYDQECLNITVQKYKTLIDEIISSCFMFSNKRDEDIAVLRNEKNGDELMNNITIAYEKMTEKDHRLDALTETYQNIMDRIRLSLMSYTTAPIIRNEYIKLYFLTEKEFDVASYKWKKCLKYSKRAIDAQKKAADVQKIA